jgi:hypothetical protein
MSLVQSITDSLEKSILTMEKSEDQVLELVKVGRTDSAKVLVDFINVMQQVCDTKDRILKDAKALGIRSNKSSK